VTDPHVHLNGLSPSAAAEVLLRCCGAARWVAEMNQLRPFSSSEALYAAAERIWWSLTTTDHLAAFEHHPRIGADRAELSRRYGATAVLSQQEQAGVQGADLGVLDALAAANEAYATRFGFVFLVCATGKSAAEMLALLEARLHNERETELRIAAEEHMKITKLRLAGLGA